MKKRIKWYALGINLSALLQSIGQDIDHSYNRFPQTQVQINPNVYLATAKSSSCSYKNRYAAAQTLKSIPEFAQEAEQAFVSIAQDPNVKPMDRLMLVNSFPEKLKLLPLIIAKDSQIPNFARFYAIRMLNHKAEFTQETAQICLNIARDPASKAADRLDAAEILNETPGFTQEAAQIFLSLLNDLKNSHGKRLHIAEIFKNSLSFYQQSIKTAQNIAYNLKAEDYNRLKAGKILNNIPGFTQEAAQIFLNLIEDPKTSACIRSQSEEMLKIKPVFSAQNTNIALCIAQDPSVNLQCRLEATKILKDMPGFEQQAVQAYFSIAQDQNIDIQSRFDAAAALEKIPSFLEKAMEAHLCIIQDSKIDLNNRFAIAEYLLSSQLPNKNEIIKVVKDIFQTCSLEQASRFLEKFQNEIGEDDPIFQDLLACHIACEHQDDPNSVLFVHKEMLKKREESVQHSPLKMRIDNEEITLSNTLMNYQEEQIKALYIYRRNDIKKIKSALKDTYKISKEKIDLFLDGRSIDSVLNVLKKPFFNNFLERELKSVLDHKFHIILNKIWNEYNEKQDSEKASSLFIQLLMNIQGCETGKKDGVEHAYRLLSQDLIIDEKELSTFRLRDEIKKFLTEQFTQEKEKAILRLVQGKVGMKEHQQHDTRYIKDVIGNAIGLYPASEKRSVDWNGNVVSHSIRSLSRQDLLTLFYEYFHPNHLVSLTQDLFNQGQISFSGKAEKNLNWAVIGVILNNIKEDYFTWTEDGVTPLSITPAGASKILQILGFIERVS